MLRASAAFIVFLIAISQTDGVKVIPYKTYYYEQYVDHFNYLNTQTFAQRYLIAGRYH